MNRGATYMDGRRFRGTSDAAMIALDVMDGHTIREREIAAQQSRVRIYSLPHQ